MHNIGNGSSNNNNNNRSIVYDGKIAGLYDLEETLGSGHFAVVKLARHVFTGEKVAVKVIDKTKLDEVSRAHLFQEVRCMKLVQHPNVVRLYEVIDTQTKLYLILELGDGGDLYDYIMKHEGGLTENLAREYFRQIVRAISYCHKLHVVHRDLKPENVVFFEKLGVVKLTDFGFSNKFCPGQKLETSCGSLAYSAPEILLGDSYDAPAVDIWSLGVILYMLVCGQPPFEKANDSETLTMIMDCKYTMPAHVSQGCRNLIASMLVRAPEMRATLEEIAKDAWLMEGITPTTKNSGKTILSTNDEEEQQQQDASIQPEYLPLVSRQQVSEEDHTLIIQRMVNGNIATKEEILEALDRNEYNHITATYFLLAERKLRQKRQEQLQKKRPDLTLPVTSQTRLSPRSRIQGIKDKQSTIDTNNQLLAPTSSQKISAPRTPGAETHSGGRTRKCSIVQEEEDDEDEIPNCTKHNELLTAPLNRRGSRSEGRINLAVHEKVSNVVCTNSTVQEKSINNQQSPIVKKEIKLHRGSNMVGSASPGRGIENISGIKYVKRNAENMRMRLGKPRMLHQQIPQIIQPDIGEELGEVSLDKTATKKNLDAEKQKSQPSYQSFRSNSLDQHNTKTELNCETKFLVDSSTITIPITSNNQNEALVNIIPKYKTMPSPTRTGILMTGPRQLNEIFEEGTDIGSSDTSATTTPRPIVRAHFTGTNRVGPGSSTSTHHQHHHRRTKFNKTRTPSCSSSDASDDDSESRKKRAHKMVGDMTSKPYQVQRRDSHDDSSDSQDPGVGGAVGNNTLNAASLIYVTSSENNHKRNSSGRGGKTNNSGTGGTNHNYERNKCDLETAMTKDIICQISDISNDTLEINGPGNCSQIHQKTDSTGLASSSYRRHRNGRRRAGETRLRESQSLNRITEVQESEIPSTTATSILNSSNQMGNNIDLQGSVDTIDGCYSNRRDSIAEADESVITTIEIDLPDPKSAEITNQEVTLTRNNKKSTNISSKSTIEITNKPKSFSARLFHGFIRNKSSTSSTNPNSNNNEQNLADYNKSNNDFTQINFQKQQINPRQIIPDPHSADDVDMVLGVIRDSTTNPKSTSATKKLKMLGKYFQVHKKICFPALFHRATSGSSGGGGDGRVSNHNHKNSSSSKSSCLSIDGRLYKAQSCGSIEHNRVNLTPNLNQFNIGEENCSNLPTNRQTVLINNEKTNKILKNCLGSNYLNNSDSDINQNTGLSGTCIISTGGNNNNNNYNNNNCHNTKNHCKELHTPKSFLKSISPHLTKTKNENKKKNQQKQEANKIEYHQNKIMHDNCNELNISNTSSSSMTQKSSNESTTIPINPQPPPLSMATKTSSNELIAPLNSTATTKFSYSNNFITASMTSLISAQNQINSNNKCSISDSINNCSSNMNCISSSLNSNNTINYNIKKNNINSNSCNNLSTSTISKISSSNSSPHQINDVPLCSSKC